MLSQAHPKIMQFIKMTGNENRVICSSYTLMTELSLLQVMCNQVQGLTRVGSQLSSTLFASLHTCLCLYSMSPSSLKSMAQKRLIIIPLPIKWSEIVMKDTFSIAGCKSSCKSKKASEKCCWCCKLNRHHCNLKTYMEQWKVWWGAFITIAWGHGMDLKLFLCDYTCLQHSRQCWTLVRKDVPSPGLPGLLQLARTANWVAVAEVSWVLLRWIVLSVSYCWFIELNNLRMLLLTQSIQSSWCGQAFLLHSLDNFAVWKKQTQPIGLYHDNLGLARLPQAGKRKLFHTSFQRHVYPFGVKIFEWGQLFVCLFLFCTNDG